MPAVPRSRALVWTVHARAKMAFYKLSESRVRHVLHSPRRIEEGVAPRTVAIMQPVSVKMAAKAANAASPRKETWSQEIWVMFQDSPRERKIISAWRYPGVTKTRRELMKKIKEILSGT